jgi:dienelactone hydrolase
MSTGSNATLGGRWSQLKPHVQVFGPAGVRPTALLFHGCGGIRSQIYDYANAAAGVGWRSAVVDSYAPRGWSRTFGLTFVCTGALLRGAERAGDVLAAVHGAVGELEADPQALVLAGWSHGAWSIMDLMTMPLERAGEAGLADPSPALLGGVRGLFLGYPYAGVGALSRTRAWVRSPRVLGVLAERDHVTRPVDAERCYQAVRACGAELELWRVDATHAFDELESPLSPMRFQAELKAEAMRRFAAFLQQSAPGA